MSFGPDAARLCTCANRFARGSDSQAAPSSFSSSVLAFNRPGEQIEQPIAKVQHLPRLGIWRIFWKKADGHWHRYPPCPQANLLGDALRVIDQDGNACFFG